MNAGQRDAPERKYFAMLPHVVLAYCRTPHDLALWVTIMMIAGENGECILSARDLAELAGMSIGKVIDCRAHLLRTGLLAGGLHRDPGYPQPVWHLRIPDLWPRNSAWRLETGDSLRDRMAAIHATRESLHLVNARDEEPSPGEGGTTPGEGGTTPGEGGTSPGEAKKNLVEPNKKGEEKGLQTPAQIWETACELLSLQLPAGPYRTYLQNTAGVSYDNDTFTIAVESDCARQWLVIRLQPSIAAQLERLIGARPGIEFVVR